MRPDGAGMLSRAHILPHMAHLYPIGLYRVGSHQLYTNRGLGVWPPPLPLQLPSRNYHLYPSPFVSGKLLLQHRRRRYAYNE